MLYTLLQSDKTDVLPTLELDCLFVTPISFVVCLFFSTDISLLSLKDMQV